METTTFDLAPAAAELRRVLAGVRPAVPVPDDAPVLQRLLGATGRDPAWRAR